MIAPVGRVALAGALSHRLARSCTYLATCRRLVRYLVMKEKATLTEPAACLLAVTSTLAKQLDQGHEGLARSLKRAASSLVLTCIKGNPNCPSGAERARAAASRCYHLLARIDSLHVGHADVVHKGLHLAGRILCALPEGTHALTVQSVDRAADSAASTDSTSHCAPTADLAATVDLTPATTVAGNSRAGSTPTAACLLPRKPPQRVAAAIPLAATRSRSP